MAFNVLAGMQHVQDGFKEGRAEGERNRFASLTGAAMSGDPTAIEQQYSLDPQRAAQVQSGAAVSSKRAAGAARYMLDAIESGDMAKINGSYKAVRPFFQRLAPDRPLPDALDETNIQGMQPMLHRVMAAAGGAEADTGVNVQSRFIDAAGNVMALMRDGSVRDLGIKADPRTKIIEGAGGFYGVDERSFRASPVQVGGAPQQSMAPGEVPFTIDPSLPPEVQAAIRANPAAGSAQGITSLPMGGGYVAGGQLQAAPETVSPVDAQRLQLDAERLRLQQNADARAAAAANKPPAADMKAVQEAQKKMPQLQNAVRGIERIDQALQALNMPGVNTGPVDQYLVRNLPAGQELEAAVGAIQNSVLALTRVPGVGSQSDLEQRVAMLQYPSLDKDPAVNARTMQNLRAFISDLQAAFQNVAQGGIQTTDAVVPMHPQGNDIDSLLDLYR